MLEQPFAPSARQPTIRITSYNVCYTKLLRFTSKEHIYSPGAKVKKQLIVVNDEREDLTCEFSFWVKGCNIKPNYGKVLVRAGTRVQQKVELDLNEKIEVKRNNFV